MTNAEDQTYIAVDFGGTNIRAARFTPNGRLLARARNPTMAETGTEAIFDRITDTVLEVMPATADSVRAVGIGSPGPLNPFTGVIIHSPNIPDFHDFPLVDRLTRILKLPVCLNNDANVAALGEWKFGAAQGSDDLIYMTVSTGVGAGVICSGTLIQGFNGLGGELGHTVIDPDGPWCSCGRRGHLEAYASGTSIARTARSQLRAAAKSSIREMVNGDIRQVTAAHVGQAALDGDPFARGVIEEAGHFIGIALTNFVHIFNPELIVMGGGVSNLGDLLFSPMREELQKRAMDRDYWENLRIVKAALNDDAGLYGALVLAQQMFPQEVA